MKVYIDYNGKVYETESFKPEDLEEFEQFFIRVAKDEFNHVRVKSDDGAIAIFPSDILKQCVFVIK